MKKSPVFSQQYKAMVFFIIDTPIALIVVSATGNIDAFNFNVQSIVVYHIILVIQQKIQ